MSEKTKSNAPLGEEPGISGSKKDFAGQKLGFMWFVIIMYSLIAAVTLTALLITSRDDMVYDAGTFYQIVNTLLAVGGIWLIAKRMRLARPVFILTNILDIVFAVVRFASDSGDVFNPLLSAGSSSYILSGRAGSKRCW